MECENRVIKFRGHKEGKERKIRESGLRKWRDIVMRVHRKTK